MLLPFDPLLAVRFRGLRLTARLSTLGVLAIVALGLAARDGAVSLAPGRLAGAGLVLGAVLLPALAGGAATVRAARSRGVAVGRVHLLTFGVLAETDAPTPDPRAEATVGAAGLAAALGAGLLVGCGALLAGARSAGDPAATPALAAGALALGQAFPVLPTAGGRLLTALGWYLGDERAWGTRAAAAYAHLVAAGLVVGSALLLGQGGALPFWGLWGLAAGWQLSGAARAIVERGRWAELAWSLTLGDAVAPFRPIPARTAVGDAFETLIAAGPGASLLVTGAAGEAVGTVGLGDLRAARRSAWDRVTVGEVAAPLAGLPRLSDADPAGRAVALLQDGRPLLVQGADGRPVAAVTRVQLVRRLAERARGRGGASP